MVVELTEHGYTVNRCGWAVERGCSIDGTSLLNWQNVVGLLTKHAWSVSGIEPS